MTQNGDLELTILMPCLNEAGTLATCIQKAHAFLSRSGIRGEIVVADNGSTDGSVAIAEASGARLVHVPARGYGAALLHGMRAARGTYVVMGDSDDSYDFSRLEPFVENLRTGSYLDFGVDPQLEQPLIGQHWLTFHAAYINEKQTLDSSNQAIDPFTLAPAPLSNPSNKLHTLRADGTLLLKYGYALSLGYFNTTGSRDALLYPGVSNNPSNASASGKPDSDGFIAQGDYMPWENVQLILQYTAYGKFNGGRKNYNGAGRNASDNNTLFVLLMFDL